MKSLKALLIVTLLTASVAAMAEDGGNTVMAKMDTATATAMAMAKFQQSVSATATATASNSTTSSAVVSRSN